MSRKRKKVDNGLVADHLIALLHERKADSVGLGKVLRSMVSACKDETNARDFVAKGLLSVLPSVFQNSSSKVVTIGIELLGALSLSSCETHLKIVRDKVALEALSEISKSSDREILTAACHTIIDMAVTYSGREALRETPILESMLSLLCVIGNPYGKMRILSQQPARALNIPDTTAVQGNTRTDEARSEVIEELDDLLFLVLTAVNSLLGNSPFKPLPKDESFNTLTTLQHVWRVFLSDYHSMSATSRAALSTDELACIQKKRLLLARCIVYLGMEHDLFDCNSASMDGSFFKDTSCLQNFLGTFWEQFPVLLRKGTPLYLLPLSTQSDSPESLLKSLLASSVGSPAAPADQIDPYHLIREIEEHLGEPLVYGQDIRLVKSLPDESPEQASGSTTQLTETMQHFFKDADQLELTKYVSLEDCLKAYDTGHTVAIKGMQFRVPEIASVSQYLAKIFGQASVGANLYLTPPNAQGLSLHFDDHCVLVCQLVGHKGWQIYPSNKLIPRLYTPVKCTLKTPDFSSAMLFNLDEGSVLYVPRGCAHKAHSGHRWDEALNARQTSEADATSDDDCATKQNVSSRNYEHIGYRKGGGCVASKDTVNNCYSLHLTFGIEVEPPFEWEGFTHVALHFWSHQSRQLLATCMNMPLPLASTVEEEQLHEVCQGLLHVAIRILGEEEEGFRKACLLGIEHSDMSGIQDFPEDAKAFALKFKLASFHEFEYFKELLHHIASKASFEKAYSHTQDASNRNLSWMEWFHHIPLSASCKKPHTAWTFAMHPYNASNYSKLELETAFEKMQKVFTKEVDFHAVRNIYIALLRKYRGCRKKFINAMLALHS